jgi:hypothetical protein
MAEARGARVIKIWGDEEGLQERGISDFLICYRGRFVALEVKTANGKVARAQELFLKSVIEAGGIGKVVSSVLEVQRILNRIDRTR